jgi:acyl-CoA synthetase (AMP-forming)/AMP-acid ligase II/acyl carrier protein
MAAQALTDALLARADAQPDVVAYESVDAAGQVSALSYAQLAARSTVLAAELAAGQDGPVLLAYPAGLDYVVAIFAGFLSGRPVVPAYPPATSSLPDRTRLAAIVADAGPPVAVAPQPHPELAVPTVLAVPGADADGAPWRRPTGAAGHEVAVIQYTSGSTGQPRGVLVRHDSVAANIAAITARFGLTSASRALVWLPPFHDMGLIGGLLTPLAAGIPVRILPPGDFLRSPLWWLRQLTDSGATVSGGPNFAYDLCLRRVRTGDALSGLDLSRWRVAFNGGEPVRHRTMARFAEAFAPAGFRPEAFLPCYGLAEATLMVSAGRWRAVPGAAEGAVNCGTPVPGQRVSVVDPERLVPLADGTEGEIWVAGEHITPGYLHGRDTDGRFGELGGERHLRTGDLGYLRAGDLFVTGRAKDVIVFRGVNYHAVDVEAAALEAAGKQGGTAAAFVVETASGPLPALVLEVRGGAEPSFAAGVRAAVLSRTGLLLDLVALVPPRSVPRTSSGKVRRGVCRDLLTAGDFDGAVVNDPAGLAAVAEDRARRAAASELATIICGVVAGVCDAEECRPTDRLADVGVDSVRAAEAAAVLEDAVGLAVPLEDVLIAPTPRAVADALLTRWLADGSPTALVRDRLAAGAGARTGVV